MKIKNIGVGFVGLAILVVAIFVGLDKCGSSSKKLHNLELEFKTTKALADAERVAKNKIIEEQADGIEEKDKEIKKLSSAVIKTNKDLTKVTGELGELKKEFASLEECQVQYNKLVVAFNFAMSMVEKLGMPIEYYDELGVKQIKFPEGSITFGLNEKYEKQVKISLAYKSMYESSEGLLRIQTTRVVELEKFNKKIKLITGIKTGIGVVILIAVIGALI